MRSLMSFISASSHGFLMNDDTATSNEVSNDATNLFPSVPGVPGKDYPILASALNANDTDFNCQGKIGGK